MAAAKAGNKRFPAERILGIGLGSLQTPAGNRRHTFLMGHTEQPGAKIRAGMRSQSRECLGMPWDYEDHLEHFEPSGREPRKWRRAVPRLPLAPRNPCFEGCKPEFPVCEEHRRRAVR